MIRAMMPRVILIFNMIVATIVVIGCIVATVLAWEGILSDAIQNIAYAHAQSPHTQNNSSLIAGEDLTGKVELKHLSHEALLGIAKMVWDMPASDTEAWTVEDVKRALGAGDS